MNENTKKERPARFSTIFIVDPIRGERIQLAKFLKAEIFTIMTFISIADCFKGQSPVRPRLVIYVVRPGKTEVKHLYNIKKKFKNVDFILHFPFDTKDTVVEELKQKGFPSVYKTTNQEKIREVTLTLLAPEGIPPRTETPHPVPIPISGFEPPEKVN